MNRRNAKIIAETITNDQLEIMFERAKIGIQDWSKVSNVNKGMSKGVAWNILYRAFDKTKEIHHLGKLNMVHEFGDFIVDEFDIPGKGLTPALEIHHQEPNFSPISTGD